MTRATRLRAHILRDQWWDGPRLRRPEWSESLGRVRRSVLVEVRAAFAAADHGDFVRGVYRWVLGRPADAEALRVWGGALGNGMSRGELFREIAGSEEAAIKAGPIDWAAAIGEVEPGALWERIAGLWDEPADEFVSRTLEAMLLATPGADAVERRTRELSRHGDRARLVRDLLDDPAVRAAGLSAGSFPQLAARDFREFVSALRRAWTRCDGGFVDAVGPMLCAGDWTGHRRHAALARLADRAERPDAVRERLVREWAAGGPAAGAPAEWERRPGLATADGTWRVLRDAWGLPMAEFVEACYRSLLLRDPDPSGAAEFLPFDGLPGGRAEVVRILSGSSEAVATGLDVSDWGDRLERASAPRVAARLRRLMAADVDVFARAAFDLLLGRAPTDAESADARAELAARPRAAWAIGLATRPDALLPAGEAVPSLELLDDDGVWHRVRLAFRENSDAFAATVIRATTLRPVRPTDAHEQARPLRNGEPRAAWARAAARRAAESGTPQGWVDRLCEFETAHVLHTLRLLWRQPDGPFARGVLRALWHREPSEAEVLEGVHTLGRVSRLEFAADAALCPEGAAWATDPSWLLELASLVADDAPADGTLAARVRWVYRANLGREPGEAEVAARVRALRWLPGPLRKLWQLRVMIGGPARRFADRRQFVRERCAVAAVARAVAQARD